MMSKIQFSGTHVFQLDRHTNADESHKLALNIYGGEANGRYFQVDTLTNATTGTRDLRMHHLMALQGNTEADDRVILRNAVKLGVAPSSIESTTSNLLPMTEGSIEESLFDHFTQTSGVFRNAKNSVNQLLQNAESASE